MPSAHGFDVYLETNSGEEFPEYGHQHLGGSIARSKTISTKVQARDRQRFRISVGLELPFPFYGEKGKAALNPTDEQSDRIGDSIGRYNLRSSLSGSKKDQKQDRASSNNNSSNRTRKVPFNFVAWVYIDGNETPECSQILYTDFNQTPLEPYTLRGRYTAAHKGRSSGSLQQDIMVQEWFFTPVGIDVLLSKMDIAAPDPKLPANVLEQELDEVIEGLADVNAVKRSKPGQIEVRITRIVDLGHGSQSDWSRAEEESQEEDAEGTHTVSVCEPWQRMRVKACAWRAYDESEEYYAKFIFQYMAIEKLVNLGLCTADGEPLEHLRPNIGASPISSLSNSASASSQASSLKRLRSYSTPIPKGDTSELGAYPWSTDEEDHGTADTESSDDSDRPRKRHEATIAKVKPRAFKKLTGSGVKQSALQGRFLMPDLNRNGAGVHNEGSNGVELEERKDSSGVGDKPVLVEAEDGGEDKIE
ncbi:hypothetical protein A1O1_04161 [Capronia coronata CBS 617.96]|uniref:Uncharacterized protein n=1 Tax=Capronia coronata CBS 617.96 TaxID=1182541 RepID=W9Z967_9EURO|nr:uncharacterized protein A1O1_04161 [Capronia coronata CBS 617.96]EXJ91054.1 hypothetical protein A1O1_04161 [Capronia coronata CBS 617.96]